MLVIEIKLTEKQQVVVFRPSDLGESSSCFMLPRPRDETTYRLASAADLFRTIHKSYY
jgi:hypothetical protein